MAFEYEKETSFKGITSIQKDNLSNNLILGVQDFLSWGFLKIGAFQNVTRDPAVSGYYGDDVFHRYRLSKSDDPSYEEGQVWEGFRNDWVWESGVSFESTEPIPVSGVWIDNMFYGSGDQIYSHFVDYPNGRVVFDIPVESNKTVEANFSHRTVGVSLSSEKYIQELMYDSYDMEDIDTYLMAGSGARNRIGETRLQLPVVALELAGGGKYQGYQLGGGQIAYTDVLFHVFAENEFDKNNIKDIIMNQNEKMLYLIDRGLMRENENYPLQLNSLGYPVDSAKMYPDLIMPTGDGGFRWNKTRIEKVACTDMEPVNGWLYRSTIRATFSVIMYKI